MQEAEVPPEMWRLIAELEQAVIAAQGQCDSIHLFFFLRRSPLFLSLSVSLSLSLCG
jgi:hypothetical protein